MTLHLKPLIPLIIKFYGNHEVYIYLNIRNQINYFNNLEKKILNKPTAVNIVNFQSIKWIAKEIGLEKEFSIIKSNKIKFINSISSQFVGFNYIIGTTKSLDFMKKKFYKKNVFFVGYQHMPVYGKVLWNKNLENNLPNIILNNLFFKRHKFEKILTGTDIYFGGFLHTNHLVLEKNLIKDNIFFFHPGGWRGIFTNYGDNKEISYRKQKKKLTELILPISKKNYVIIIKCHPLAAKFHKKQDLLKIISEIKSEFKIINKIVVIDTIYDQINYIKKSKIIFTFGSSSIFELWSVGIKNIKVLSFFSKSRSDQFKYFFELFVRNYENYKNIIHQIDDFNQNEYSDDVLNLFNSYYKEHSDLLTKFLNYMK